jgi:hypothetical protein
MSPTPWIAAERGRRASLSTHRSKEPPHPNRLPTPRLKTSGNKGAREEQGGAGEERDKGTDRSSDFKKVLLSLYVFKVLSFSGDEHWEGYESQRTQIPHPSLLLSTSP